MPANHNESYIKVCLFTTFVLLLPDSVDFEHENAQHAQVRRTWKPAPDFSQTVPASLFLLIQSSVIHNRNALKKWEIFYRDFQLGIPRLTGLGTSYRVCKVDEVFVVAGTRRASLRITVIMSAV